MSTPSLIKNLLNKKKSDCYPGKDECHPQPDFTADSHFSFGIQIIPKGDTDENDRNGDENDSY